MSIPFFLFAGALAAIFYGKRNIAIESLLVLSSVWEKTSCYQRSVNPDSV